MSEERVVIMGKLTNRICEYRSVDGDGRITCQKIVEGDQEVSPNLCRDCPARQINCDELRFSLRKSSPSPIVVRYGNGHSEVWNDDPPRIGFVRAACAARITPIGDPRQCAVCALRTVGQPILEEVSWPRVVRPEVATGGKVIAFPQRVAAAAS
ncbi:MAG: hypothetical protein FJ014_14810 [Chloroflexi bacterium]|nr:hypothetical protein [Chloroflexota bacterium]